MAYLSNWQDSLAQDQREQEFRDLIFANDLNPFDDLNLRRYNQIFGQPTSRPLHDDEIDWIVPDSPEEAEDLLDELREIFPLS